MLKKLILIAVLLMAGGIAFIALQAERVETVRNTLSAQTIGKATEILNRDKDGDGLKDWEEDLWKTDSEKTDTDGDGTTDGDEIRAERDPLTVGPNDKLDRETAKTKISSVLPKEETETDIVSQKFFGRYLELRKTNGGAITPEEIETLVTQTLSDVAEEGTFAAYDPTDLIPAEANSGSLHAYGNAVSEIVLASPPEESEFDILKEALETEDARSLDRLDQHIALYTATVERLLALPVPTEAALAHVRLLNAFATIRDATAGIQKLFTDSLRALPAIPNYQKGSDELVAALTMLQLILKREGVVFSKEESGYLLQTLGI